MQIAVALRHVPPTPWDALILPVPQSQEFPSDLFTFLGDDAIARSVWEWNEFRGENKQLVCLHTPNNPWAKRLCLVGLGQKSDLETLRQAVGSATTALAKMGAQRVAAFTSSSDASAMAEGFILANYRFDRYRTTDLENLKSLSEATLLVSEDLSHAQTTTEKAILTASAACWARDLSNMPCNDLNPVTFTQMAEEMARDRGISVQVIAGDELAQKGLNLLHAVGKGSQYPARLVILDYPGQNPTEQPIALVGKGITFDTGGISIKPREKMEQMKDDMSGAAAVLGTLRSLADQKYPHRVVGFLAIAENMPGDNSYKPGDLFTAYNGKTVEIINTDAEGRIALADALAYADKHYNPAAMVDLATLTGACVVALGHHATGIMCADESLSQALQTAGRETGEKLWPLPLWDAYDELFEGDIADFINCNESSEGDAVAAAAFLRKFAGDRPWAHLDIAGTSWTEETKPYQPKGATGVGVRLLTHWLNQKARS